MTGTAPRPGLPERASGRPLRQALPALRRGEGKLVELIERFELSPARAQQRFAACRAQGCDELNQIVEPTQETESGIAANKGKKTCLPNSAKW